MRQAANRYLRSSVSSVRIDTVRLRNSRVRLGGGLSCRLESEINLVDLECIGAADVKLTLDVVALACNGKVFSAKSSGELASIY